MDRLVLLVDAKCGPCSRLGKQASALSDRLEVRGLNEPFWRGLVAPDEPTLLDRATGRTWRRTRLLLKLSVVLGPGRAVSLLAAAGTELGGGAGHRPRWPRLRGLRVAAGVAAPWLVGRASPPDRVR